MDKRKVVIGGLGILALGFLAWKYLSPAALQAGAGVASGLPPGTPGTFTTAAGKTLKIPAAKQAIIANPAGAPQVTSAVFLGGAPAGLTAVGVYHIGTGVGRTALYKAGSNWFENNSGYAANNGWFQIPPARAKAVMKSPKVG